MTAANAIFCRGDLWSPAGHWGSPSSWGATTRRAARLPGAPPEGRAAFLKVASLDFYRKRPRRLRRGGRPHFFPKKWGERRGRGASPALAPPIWGFMAAVGCNWPVRTGPALPPVVGASFRSFASPQAAKLTPSTVPLLPSRHCDSRAKLARQSRRSFFPARFIRHWRRFAGKLSPPNPLRWASAGAPCSFTSQALPRLGRHASGLPCKLWE